MVGVCGCWGGGDSGGARGVGHRSGGGVVRVWGWWGCSGVWGWWNGEGVGVVGVAGVWWYEVVRVWGWWGCSRGLNR